MTTTIRANLSAEERRQVLDAARNANAEDAEVYAAIRACSLSCSADLETTVKPAEARAMVKELSKEIERCPSAPTPATPSPSPSPKTQASRRTSSGALSADS